MRELILVVTEDCAIKVETEFSNDEIEDVSSIIQDELIETDDGWNEDKLIDELQKRGYIKVIEPGIEVFDLML